MKKIIIMFMMVIVLACGVEAKTLKHGIVYEKNQEDFRIYRNGKMQTGWVRYGKKVYYLYKTNGKNHKKGYAARNVIRYKKGNFYYFTNKGSLATKPVSDRYNLYEAHKNGKVKYIYKKRGAVRGCRYNCKTHYVEWHQKNGTWKKRKDDKPFMWDGIDKQE